MNEPLRITVGDMTYVAVEEYEPSPRSKGRHPTGKHLRNHEGKLLYATPNRGMATAEQLGWRKPE